MRPLTNCRVGICSHFPIRMALPICFSDIFSAHLNRAQRPSSLELSKPAYIPIISLRKMQYGKALRRYRMINPEIALFTILGTLGYFGLAVLGWGGLATFFSHPARIALAVA